MEEQLGFGSLVEETQLDTASASTAPSMVTLSTTKASKTRKSTRSVSPHTSQPPTPVRGQPQRQPQQRHQPQPQESHVSNTEKYWNQRTCPSRHVQGDRSTPCDMDAITPLLEQPNLTIVDQPMVQAQITKQSALDIQEKSGLDLLAKAVKHCATDVISQYNQHGGGIATDSEVLSLLVDASDGIQSISQFPLYFESLSIEAEGKIKESFTQGLLLITDKTFSVFQNKRKFQVQTHDTEASAASPSKTILREVSIKSKLCETTYYKEFRRGSVFSCHYASSATQKQHARLQGERFPTMSCCHRCLDSSCGWLRCLWSPAVSLCCAAPDIHTFPFEWNLRKLVGSGADGGHDGHDSDEERSMAVDEDGDGGEVTTCFKRRSKPIALGGRRGESEGEKSLTKTITLVIDNVVMPSQTDYMARSPVKILVKVAKFVQTAQVMQIVAALNREARQSNT
eukprot:m.156613 g.156613  ORF g.156613 m.156613 type:complete len:454 (-) comp14328_c0_seq1:235-1596(-)